MMHERRLVRRELNASHVFVSDFGLCRTVRFRLLLALSLSWPAPGFCRESTMIPICHSQYSQMNHNRKSDTLRLL